MEIKNKIKYLFVLLAIVFLAVGCTNTQTKTVDDDNAEVIGDDSGTPASDDVGSIIDDQLIEDDNIELGELI